MLKINLFFLLVFTTLSVKAGYYGEGQKYQNPYWMNYSYKERTSFIKKVETTVKSNYTKLNGEINKVKIKFDPYVGFVLSPYSINIPNLQDMIKRANQKRSRYKKLKQDLTIDPHKSCFVHYSKYRKRFFKTSVGAKAGVLGCAAGFTVSYYFAAPAAAFAGITVATEALAMKYAYHERKIAFSIGLIASLINKDEAHIREYSVLLSTIYLANHPTRNLPTDKELKDYAYKNIDADHLNTKCHKKYKWEKKKFFK